MENGNLAERARLNLGVRPGDKAPSVDAAIAKAIASGASNIYSVTELARRFLGIHK